MMPREFTAAPLVSQSCLFSFKEADGFHGYKSSWLCLKPRRGPAQVLLGDPSTPFIT